MTELERKLSAAIDAALTESIGVIDGKEYTLAEAIHAYRGGDYIATKWKKLSEQRPKKRGAYLIYYKKDYGDGREGNIAIDLFTYGGVFVMEKTWDIRYWMPLPCPPKPEGEKE